MATVYGSTVKSAWRSYLKYTVEETPTQYVVSLTDVGISLLSGWEVKMDFASTIKANGETYYSPDIAYSEYYSSSTSQKGEFYDNPFPHTIDEDLSIRLQPYPVVIDKTASVQSITLSYKIQSPKWYKIKKSTGETVKYTSGTSTASITFEVKPLEKPKVSIAGVREANSPTTVGFSVTVNSWESDEVDISIVDGNGNILGSTSNAITIGETGQIVQPFVTEGLTTGSIIAYAVATGRGGSSARASVTIPVAFFTMDVQSGGKEIAFGSSAISETANGSEHGEFNCYMNADFKNGITVGGHNSKMGAEATAYEGSANNGNSVSTTGWVDLKGSVTLGKGSWMVVASARFKDTSTVGGSTANTTAGNRYIALAVNGTRHDASVIGGYVSAKQSVRYSTALPVKIDADGTVVNIKANTSTACGVDMQNVEAIRIV